MGMHGTSTRAYHFDNVKVPIENVLGEAGRGHIVALNALNMGCYKVGAVCIGNAKAAFYEAVKYARQRVQFGRPICEFGLIKEKISEMSVRLFAAESMMYRTAGLIQAKLEDLDMNSDDAGIRTAEALEEFIIECSINKIYGAETEDCVIGEEVQIFGGYGYIKGNHPELAYRNARINRIWEGTNEINRIVIVNTLLRRVSNGTLDLMSIFYKASDNIEKLEPVSSDDPKDLNTQTKLIQIAKNISLLVIGIAYEKYGNNIREEQEIVGMISNIIIEIYAMESALLRFQKMLHSNKPERSIIMIKMTKVLVHDSLEKISFLARNEIEAMENGILLEKHLNMIRRLMVSPPINTVSLRRDIADVMIGYGRYGL